MSGVAAVVSGASGTTVSVTVSPVVTSEVVTGPGGGGSAVLLISREPNANAPMATTALAPNIADAILTRFEFTFDHSNRSLVERPASGRLRTEAA